MGIICSKGVVLSLPLYIHKNTVIAHGYGMILRIISGSTYYNHTVWRSCYRCYVKQPLWGSCNVKTGSWKRKEYMGNKNSQYGCNTQKLVKLFVYVILYTEMLPHPHTSFFFFFWWPLIYLRSNFVPSDYKGDLSAPWIDETGPASIQSYIFSVSSTESDWWIIKWLSPTLKYCKKIMMNLRKMIVKKTSEIAMEHYITGIKKF